MHKLRKAPPASVQPAGNYSRTMMLAKTAAEVGTVALKAPGSGGRPNIRPAGGLHHSASSTPHMTASEQYWAARAMTAESLLSAKIAHQTEINNVSIEAEIRRTQELTTLRKEHASSQSKLETLVIFLSGALLVLVGVVIYAFLGNAKVTRKSSAMHFTIPILSPFASVVEHESSVIGSKTLAIFALMAVLLLYGCFRYWLTHRGTR